MTGNVTDVSVAKHEPKALAASERSGSGLLHPHNRMLTPELTELEVGYPISIDRGRQKIARDHRHWTAPSPKRLIKHPTQHQIAAKDTTHPMTVRTVSQTSCTISPSSLG
jgi:hypothetical protein